MNPIPIAILVAEDDPDDQLLITDAFAETGLPHALAFVEDGQALLDYLEGRGNRDAAGGAGPTPQVVVLDLNMPRKDGREALAEIKANPRLRGLPIIVLTTSSADDDVRHSYDMGVCGYITKPVTFKGLMQVASAMGDWLRLVRLPPNPTTETR